MTETTGNRSNDVSCASCADAGRLPKLSPTEGTLNTARQFAHHSKSFVKIGLVAFLFLCLIILSSTEVAEGRRLSRKLKGKPPPGENEIRIDETARKGSRRRSKKKILKSSDEARVLIAEKHFLKEDWCHMRPLKQVIRTRNGCEGRFLNNLCYGQCNSFYIPRDLAEDGAEQQPFKSCSFCKPYRMERVQVTLTCSGRRRGKETITRMVNRVAECRCIAVPDVDSQTPAPEAFNPTASKTGEASPGGPRM